MNSTDHRPGPAALYSGIPAKQPRMNRLFNGASRRCFDVAVDHGFFNEGSFLGGIEDIAAAVRTLVAAGPDAIQLTPGQAGHLQAVPSARKPALVLRTDVANIYGRVLSRRPFSRMIAQPVVQAARLDAACVVVNLFQLPEAPEVTEQCIQNILAIKPACDDLGMPLMIEPLVLKPNETHGGYAVDGATEKIVPLVRQAVELGADIVKADPTDDISEYHEVIQTAGPVPVLVRGGSKASDHEILRRTEQLIAQGSSGIVYGRNVVQHAAPAKMTRALMAIVHEGSSAEAAARYLA